MSAVHKPNLNFDNERMEHTPYSEIVKGQIRSSYEQFRRPKSGKAESKQKPVKQQKSTTSYAAAFKRFFK